MLWLDGVDSAMESVAGVGVVESLIWEAHVNSSAFNKFTVIKIFQVAVNCSIGLLFQSKASKSVEIIGGLAPISELIFKYRPTIKY